MSKFKTKFTICITSCIILFSLTGCVKQSDYDALQSKFNDLQSDYMQLQDEYEDLNDKYNADMGELQNENEELEETVLLYYELLNPGLSSNTSGADEADNGQSTNSVSINKNDIEAAKQFAQDKMDQVQNGNSGSGADIARDALEEFVTDGDSQKAEEIRQDIIGEVNDLIGGISDLLN